METAMQASRPPIRESHRFVRGTLFAVFFCLAGGCVDRTPSAPPTKATRKRSIPKPTRPPLPITLHEILNLSGIQIEESSPYGPGFRYWHFTTNLGIRELYVDTYDGSNLNTLTVTVMTGETTRQGDDLKKIHELLCQIRPEDDRIRTHWPDSTAEGFSLPASTVHDGMLLNITREVDRTVLTVTGAEENNKPQS